MGISAILTITAFAITMLLIFWRPRGINEAVAAVIGAILVLMSGSVTIADIQVINAKVTGAAITIIATMVMALTMESIGFFHWIAVRLLKAAKGSGIRLFWLTNLLCFCMTLFLNNDGSILITTPVLLLILRNIGLKNKQKLPYLISGALIATASSTPIGVSNIVNLISLEIIGMDLYMHTLMMFVPGTLGLLCLSSILFMIFRNKIPKKIPYFTKNMDYRNLSNLHPLMPELEETESKSKTRLMIWVMFFVLLARILLFVASYYSLPIAIVAVISSLSFLGWRWLYLKKSPLDMLKKTPWHIFVFAYTMYIIVYGLYNIGLTDQIVLIIEPIIQDNLFNASMTMGAILTLLSNIFNNHPALMLGTLSITEMSLDAATLKTVYLANIIGSDIGSLLLPTGTLATLIWFHILKKHNLKVSWSQYIKVTIIAIPLTVIFTLVILYFWVGLFF